MSFYAVVEGQLKYPTEESFNRVISFLETGCFIDKDGYFVDECDARIQSDVEFEFAPNIDRENLTIDIPLAHYRNLSRVDFFLNKKTAEEIAQLLSDSRELPIIDPFGGFLLNIIDFANCAHESVVSGWIVGTSTDGCFDGWYIEDGKETTYDLQKWALENIDDEGMYPPRKEDYEDDEAYQRDFNDWQGSVEQEFIADHN